MPKRFISLFIILLVLGVVNAISSRMRIRWDLTADKRHTIAPATRQMLENLEKYIHVTVYLHGDFPPGFERLENATRETLTEFAAYSNGKLTFHFTDPSNASGEEQRQKQFAAIIDKGLSPTNLFSSEGGKRTERMIFPGALVQADTLSVPVNLLKSNRAESPEEQLNQSYENVEFELANAIRMLSSEEKKKIGLLVSHSHTPTPLFSDLIATVQQYYDVFLDVNQPESYEGLDALMVLKPDKGFTEEEKFKLDQYVVKGGKALFFIDGAKVDSVSEEGTYAQPLDLNLADLFYKWGVRVNHNIVKDLNCAPIALNVGQMGDRPQIQPLPWRFYPLLGHFGNHPVTRNINAVYTRYLSSVDTVGGNPGISKTYLLSTSPYTNLLNTPVIISYNEARKQPDPEAYNQGVKPAFVLLEGKFNSLFNNRILPGDPRLEHFVNEGTEGKVLIGGDGDVVLNDFDRRRNSPLPLGYDRISGNTFGNKDFILHALDYLTDPQGLIIARTKQVIIRPLDKIKIGNERLYWQLLNIGGPVMVVLISGLLRFYLYSRKFGRRTL